MSVDETLKLLDCKDQQKRLTDAELELAAAKSKGYVSKYGVSSNGTATGHRLHAVVGVMTNFGSRSRREAIRKNLLPSGTTLQELEDNKGIVIRFVIGRRSSSLTIIQSFPSSPILKAPIFGGLHSHTNAVIILTLCQIFYSWHLIQILNCALQCQWR